MDNPCSVAVIVMEPVVVVKVVVAVVVGEPSVALACGDSHRDTSESDCC